MRWGGPTESWNGNAKFESVSSPVTDGTLKLWIVYFFLGHGRPANQLNNNQKSAWLEDFASHPYEDLGRNSIGKKSSQKSSRKNFTSKIYSKKIKLDFRDDFHDDFCDDFFSIELGPSIVDLPCPVHRGEGLHLRRLTGEQYFGNSVPRNRLHEVILKEFEIWYTVSRPISCLEQC